MDIASACLVGKKCRYDGQASEDDRIKQLYKEGKLKAVCPECLGELPVPRCPSEIIGGGGADVLRGDAKVMSKDGSDLTQAFIEGAQKTLETARSCGAKRAYFKSRSPSCGCGRIYDGSFSGRLVPGDGVAAVLLKRSGIEVIEV